MTKGEYVSAIDVILAHDVMITRVRDVSISLAKEVGDDFGACVLVPQSDLRGKYIELVQMVSGDNDGTTDYLINECQHMDGTGFILHQCGTKFPIATPEDAWAEIQFQKQILDCEDTK